MEDIRIGRKTAVVEKSVTVALTNTEFIDYDAKRVMLIIFPPASGTLTISVGKDPATNSGITLPSTGNPIVLDIKIHGQLVTKAFTAVHSAGAVKCYYYQGHLDDE